MPRERNLPPQSGWPDPPWRTKLAAWCTCLLALAMVLALASEAARAAYRPNYALRGLPRRSTCAGC